MKICKKCGIEKDLSEFYKRNDMADGYLSDCKKCGSECRKKRYQKAKAENPNYLRECYLKDRTKILEHQKKYRENNKDKESKRKAKWYQENRERIDIIRRENGNIKRYYIRHRTRLLEYQMELRRKKKEEKNV